MQKVIINGKEYNISFNFGVIKNIVKDCEYTVPEMISKLSNGDLEVISSVLYNGIKFNHPDFEQSEIDTLSLSELFETFNVLGGLMNNNMPQNNNSKKTVNKK